MHDIAVTSEQTLWTQTKEIIQKANYATKEGKTKKVGRDTLIPKLRFKVAPVLELFNLD